jgi:hypothetical protein
MKLAMETIVIFIIAILVLVLMLFIFGDQFKTFFNTFDIFMKNALGIANIDVNGTIQ